MRNLRFQAPSPINGYIYGYPKQKTEGKWTDELLRRLVS